MKPEIDLEDWTYEKTEEGVVYTKDNLKILDEKRKDGKFLVFVKPLLEGSNQFYPLKYIDNKFDLLILTYEFCFQKPTQNMMSLLTQEEIFTTLKDNYENYKYIIYNKELSSFFFSNDDSLDYLDSFFDVNNSSYYYNLWKKEVIEIIDIEDTMSMNIFTENGWKPIEEEPNRKTICSDILNS